MSNTKVRSTSEIMNEIEAVLKAYDGIAEAAIISIEQHDSTEFVGYFTRFEGNEVNAKEVLEHLRKKVPSYMVPVRLDCIKSMPLLENGNIDRQSLLTLSTIDGEPQMSYVAALRAEIGLSDEELSAVIASRRPLNQPRGRRRPFSAIMTATEESLAAIWKTILGVDDIGKTDDFFDMGGHSLLAIELVIEVSKTFRKELTLYEIFEHRRLDSISSIIDSKAIIGCQAT